MIGLADYEVFPNLLMPGQVTWYAQFARNRMVIAYTDHSKFATGLTAQELARCSRATWCRSWSGRPEPGSQRLSNADDATS